MYSRYTSTNKSGESKIYLIDGMEGHEFEYFCAELLKRNGFYNVSVTPGSGDQGVDVLAVKDGIKYAVQCKNYYSALGNTPVQEVNAGRQFYGCHVGVVMTNSSFTPGAVQLAEATNVLLWDRHKLEEMISIAGGLENLGIEIDNEDDDPEDEDEYDYEDDYTKKVVYERTVVYENKPYDKRVYSTNPNLNEQIWMPVDSNHDTTEKKKTRKVMRFFSYVSFFWTGVCFLIAIIAKITNSSEMTFGFLGEGLFIGTLGVMFSMLSKTEKTSSTIMVFKWRLKKPSFVLLSIACAYALFIICIFLMGGPGAMNNL